MEEQKKLIEQIRLFHEKQARHLTRALLVRESTITPEAALTHVIASNNRWLRFLADLLDLDDEMIRDTLQISRKKDATDERQ